MDWRYGAALLVSLAATPALALLGLDSTPPTVTIVKPASGAAVSGESPRSGEVSGTPTDTLTARNTP